VSVRRPSNQVPNLDARLDDLASSLEPQRAQGEARDWGFRAIVVLVALIAVWLLWMPWSVEITRITMRRFQLQTNSFLMWAVQFPIPAMYNFANEAEIDPYPPGLVDPIFAESETRYLNHFPVRCITFGDGRYHYLQEGRDRWITVETRYRGRRLESRFHAHVNPDGRVELIRLSSETSKR
jgi:hypothetical protein